MNAFIDWVFLSLWNFYVVHGVISLLIALIGAWFLNRHYKDQFFRYVMIVFVFNIALPVIGYILSIWLVYYLLNVQYRTELSNVDYIDMFEFENEFPQWLEEKAAQIRSDSREEQQKRAEEARKQAAEQAA